MKHLGQSGQILLESLMALPVAISLVLLLGYFCYHASMEQLVDHYTYKAVLCLSSSDSSSTCVAQLRENLQRLPLKEFEISRCRRDGIGADTIVKYIDVLDKPSEVRNFLQSRITSRSFQD